MANAVTAYVVVACIVMAFIVMACIVATAPSPILEPGVPATTRYETASTSGMPDGLVPDGNN